MQVYGSDIDEYRFWVNNTLHYIKLIAGCFVVFLLLAIIWMVVIVKNLFGEDAQLVIGVAALATPFILFLVFRRRTADECVAKLTDTGIELLRNEVSITIRFADMEKYYFYSVGNSKYDDEGNKVVLKINSIDGKKIRLKATADVCDVEPLRDFCINFDTLASQRNVARKFMLW